MLLFPSAKVYYTLLTYFSKLIYKVSKVYNYLQIHTDTNNLPRYNLVVTVVASPPPSLFREGGGNPFIIIII